MAGKNQVTLTFAGDSTKLQDSFDKVGSSAKTMQDEVKGASKDVSDGFDRAGEAADGTYDKFDALESLGRGTTDTMSGLGEIMSGNVLQGATDLAGGVAALADGFAGALLPALKHGVSGFKAAAVAAKTFTLSLLTNPVFLIGSAIALLVVGLIVLYKKSETARNIMNGAFRSVASVIAVVVTGALRYFQFLANTALLVAEKVIGAFAKIPGPQQKALKAAANQIRDWRADTNRNFDRAIGKVGELNRKIQGIPDAKMIRVTVVWKQVGDRSVSLNAPGASGIGRAGGGPVTAGMPYVVGERGPEWFVPRTSGTIIPNGGGSGAAGGTRYVIPVHVNGSRALRALLTDLRDEIRRTTGGNVELALGS